MVWVERGRGRCVAGESLGMEQKVHPGGGSLVWKGSEGGMRQHDWSKWSLCLSRTAESSHGLPATCSLDHIPWGRPTKRWQLSLASCTAQFLPCMVLLLPAIFQCCLGHCLLPNASPLLGPQLVPFRPFLLENCCTGGQEMRAETLVSSAFLGLCLMWLASVFFRFPSLVTFCHFN